jgi:hypothetical protein
METLKLDERLALREPDVLLNPQLPVGTYRVELVVEGSSGKSEPAFLLIKVFKE